MDHSIDFDVDGFADLLDEVHAWRLPEVFLKAMQSLVAFDNDFIHTSVFDLLKLQREGSKANFDMLSDEQKVTLKGKEIGEAISKLRRDLMWAFVEKNWRPHQFINIYMNKQDAAIIKVLSDIGSKEEPLLSPEQEEILARALDPEKEFLHSVERLFNKDKK